MLQINDTWTEIVGYQSTEIDTIEKWTSKAYGKNKAEARSMINTLYSAKGRVHDGEFTIKTKGGQEVVWDFTTAPLGHLPDGRKIVVSAAVDVTERKKADEALRVLSRNQSAILDSIPDMAWMKDAESTYIAVNSAFAEKCETDQESAAGKTDFDFWPEDLAHKYRADDRAVVTSGDVRQFSEPLSLADGNTIYIETIKTPIRDEVGTVVATVGIARDISERTKYEEISRTIQKLESLGVLAGGIAHDFNNILTGILGNLSLAKEDAEVGSKLREFIVESQNACLSAKSLTHQLLTFAKGGQPTLEAVELEPILREAGTFATRGSTGKCVFDIDTDLDPAMVDRGQVAQVVQNLVINATQAMPDGGSVTITASNVALREADLPPLGPGRYVQISVGDEGVGISQDQLPRVFDPYFSTKAEGRGLGLATCHSVIKKHGGHISVKSKLGAGTVFDIHLPATDPDEVPPESHAADIAKGSGRILIMDDEKMVSDILMTMLTRLGYECEAVPDGAGALTAYKKAKAAGKPFDLVIMDLTIPGGMGGKEAIREIRELDPNAKAIVSSGYSAHLIHPEAVAKRMTPPTVV